MTMQLHTVYAWCWCCLFVFSLTRHLASRHNLTLDQQWWANEVWLVITLVHLLGIWHVDLVNFTFTFMVHSNITPQVWGWCDRQFISYAAFCQASLFLTWNWYCQFHLLSIACISNFNFLFHFTWTVCLTTT